MYIKYILLIFAIKSIFGLYSDDPCVINFDQSPGICKIENQCQIALDLLRDKRIRPTVCGFEGHRPVLCCPVIPENTVINEEIKLGSAPERISVQKCSEYKKLQQVPLRRKRQYVIVGGTEALPDEYPHMAAIGWKMKDGSGYTWNCGGSLISERWVITAAHCTYIIDSGNFQTPEPNIVRLGEFYLKVEDETVVQDIEIDNILMHPQFKAPLKYHDIALMRLKKDAIFSNKVRPICLWQTENIAGNKSIATGWGRVGYIEDPTDYLQGVVIDIFDLDICKEFYKNRKRFLPNGIIKEQLCAGELKGGKDTCQGDSGGPLQIRDTELFRVYHLIGITSFGVGCGAENSPAMYTRVSSYLDWIESIVWTM